MSFVSASFVSFGRQVCPDLGLFYDEYESNSNHYYYCRQCEYLFMSNRRFHLGSIIVLKITNYTDFFQQRYCFITALQQLMKQFLSFVSGIY